jgi:ligand-binding sensor domain-containing protein
MICDKQRAQRYTTMIFWCCFAFGVPVTTGAQSVVCHFNQLTLEDGLSAQEYNHFVHQDAQGYVWINAIKGLNRYDGQHIQSYLKATSSKPGLLDNGLNSPFFEDAKGGIWFSSRKAAYRFQLDTEEIEPFTIPSWLTDADDTYQLKFVDPITRQVWLALNDQQMIVFPFDHPEQAKRVWENTVINYWSTVRRRTVTGERLFFSHKKEGLFVKNLKDSEQENSQSWEHWFFKNQKAYTSLHLNDSIVWVGLKNGLGVVNLDDRSEQLIFSQPKEGLIKDIIGIVAIDRTHLLVATQQSGLFIFNTVRNQYEGKLYKHLSGKVEPFEENVEGIYRAPDGVIWISVNQKGVFFTDLNKIKFRSYYLENYQEGISTGGLKMITSNTEGQIWGVSEYNVFVWGKNGIPNQQLYQQLNLNPPFAGRKLNAIFADKVDHIWVGTEFGVYYYEPGVDHFTLIPLEKDGLGGEPAVTAIYELQDNRILISTTSGVFQIKRSEPRIKWQAQVFYDNGNTCNWIYEDEKNDRVFINEYATDIVVLDRKVTPFYLLN